MYRNSQKILELYVCNDEFWADYYYSGMWLWDCSRWSCPPWNNCFLRKQNFNVQCSKKANNVKLRTKQKKSFCCSPKLCYPLLLKTVQNALVSLLKRDSMDLYGKMRQGYKRIWGRIAHCGCLHRPAKFCQWSMHLGEKMSVLAQMFSPLANLWGTGKPLCKVRTPLCDCSPSAWMRTLALVIFCLSAPPDLQDSFSLSVMIFSCPYDKQSQFDKGNHSSWML